MKTAKCVQCGYCCTVSACGYGRWNPEKNQCYYLMADKKCGKYDRIMERENNHPFPMMGCGCSSPLFNEMRDAKLKELGLNPEAEAERIHREIGIDLNFALDFVGLWDRIQDDLEEERKNGHDRTQDREHSAGQQETGA